MPHSLRIISIDGKNHRILDSVTTNHLTGSSEHFISYASSAGNEKIQIVDDPLALIVGKGQIVPLKVWLSKMFCMCLNCLTICYLAISKITREMHYKIIFLPESNCFQDMSSRRTIGIAQHSVRLYILDDDTSDSSFSRASLPSSYFSMSEHVVCCGIFG